MKRKQHRWLLLLLVGVMSLGFAACKKASEVPLDPDHIVLDDYEIWYKGFDVQPAADGQSALVLTLDFTNNGKEATSYLWAVSEKVFLDGIGLNTATVLQDGNSKGTVAETQLTEIMPGKTIEVKSAYSLPDGDKKTLEAEFSQLLGKKKGILTIDLEDTLPMKTAPKAKRKSWWSASRRTSTTARNRSSPTLPFFRKRSA